MGMIVMKIFFVFFFFFFFCDENIFCIFFFFFFNVSWSREQHKYFLEAEMIVTTLKSAWTWPDEVNSSQLLYFFVFFLNFFFFYRRLFFIDPEIMALFSVLVLISGRECWRSENSAMWKWSIFCVWDFCVCTLIVRTVMGHCRCRN